MVFTLASNGAAYQLDSSNAATVTILDNPQVQVAPGWQSTTEYTSAAELTVSRSGSDSQSLTVYFSLGGNAGTNDYSVSAGGLSLSNGAGSMVIPASASAATVTIQSLCEPAGSESVALSLLASASGYQLDGGSSAATVTLLEDPLVTITPASATTSECTSAAELTVSRTGADSQPMTVYLSLGGNANSADYSLSGVSNGRLTIPASASAATVTIERSVSPPRANRWT